MARRSAPPPSIAAGRRQGGPAIFRDQLRAAGSPAITATAEGLFTGYFEISAQRLAATRGGAYQTPLYRRPPDPARFTRAEIEDGALAGQGLELLWVDDPIDAFFLEIQGSGRVRLPDGGIVRVGYDGSNGKPYVAVGRLLIDRGELPREKLTMAAIRGWMKEHPKDGAALRRENPSYVFFREITGDGPIGAQRVVLTAGAQPRGRPRLHPARHPGLARSAGAVLGRTRCRRL